MTEHIAYDQDGLRKHGVHIREHKKWNTKTIYNAGHVMHAYRRCPKQITFVSPMVNDFNQHLCGGWHMSEITDEKEATVQQLHAGRKPFGWIVYSTEAQALDAQQRLDRAGLKTVLEPHFFGHERRQLQGCQDMKVADIGDLRALVHDYCTLPVREGEWVIDVDKYANCPLSTFFGGWDVEDIPMWLTGLILGYPVENTISLYLQR